MKTTRAFSVLSAVAAAVVGIREVLYYLDHRRSGPAFELALLAAAVVLLAISMLLNSRSVK